MRNTKQLGPCNRVRRILAAGLLICAAFSFAGAALADSTRFTVSSSVESGATVYPGDTIDYVVTITPEGERFDWDWLRVQFGANMQYAEDAIALDCADTLTEEQMTANNLLVGQEIERRIVPGNDGFVLLASSMLANDTFRFSATVGDNADPHITVWTMTDEEESNKTTVSYNLGIIEQPVAAPPSQPEPEPQPEAAPEQSKAGAPLVNRILLFVFIIALGAFGVWGYRKTGEESGKDAANSAAPNSPSFFQTLKERIGSLTKIKMPALHETPNAPVAAPAKYEKAAPKNAPKTSADYRRIVEEHRIAVQETSKMEYRTENTAATHSEDLPQ